MKHAIKTRARVLGLCLLITALTHPSSAQTVTAVPKLDMDRFTGTWYVIARIPDKYDKHCTRDAVLLVALGDKPRSLQLVNACQTKQGYIDVRNTDGKAEDKIGDGKLKLRTLWPFYRKYWVLGLGPDYSWSLVGSPNHKDLAVLSRSATLAPEVLSQIDTVATAEGFALPKLVMQPQDATYKTH